MTNNINFYNNNLLNIINGGSIENNPLKIYFQTSIVFKKKNEFKLNNADFEHNKQIIDVDISNKHDANCQSLDGYIYTFSKKIENVNCFSGLNYHNIYILKINIKTMTICDKIVIYNEEISESKYYNLFSLKIVKYKDLKGDTLEKLYYTKPDDRGFHCVNSINLKTFKN